MSGKPAITHSVTINGKTMVTNVYSNGPMGNVNCSTLCWDFSDPKSAEKFEQQRAFFSGDKPPVAKEAKPVVPDGIVDQETDNKDEQCVVCMDFRRTTVFQPCGHAACCSMCADTVVAGKRQCPTCRSVITSVGKFFLA